MGWHWRKSTRSYCTKVALLGLSALACMGISSETAHAYIQTRFVYINSQLSADGSNRRISVEPGDVITLAVDDVDVDSQGNLSPFNTALNTFIWTSTYQNPSRFVTDRCDPDQGCSQTQFQLTEYGANYYVPLDMPAELTVSVYNRFTNSQDHLTLVNSMYRIYGTDYRPDMVYSYDPFQQSSASFNFTLALAGKGRWVYISGQRVFVPYVYTADWSPFQNGYWYWSAEGWTWFSFDPWGEITDHYGFWRHHRTWGWVWSPFAATGGVTVRWYPATVTFFNTGSYVAWTPYWGYWDSRAYAYGSGYRHGYADGYDDGFNDGYEAAVRDMSGGRGRYRWGFSCVETRNFAAGNVRRVIVSSDVTVRVVSESYRERRYGDRAQVYGRGDRARVVVESAAGTRFRTVDLDISRREMAGITTGVPIVRPREQLHVTPPEIARLREELPARVRQVSPAEMPVGSIVDIGAGRITRPEARRDIEHSPTVAVPGARDVVRGRVRIAPEQLRAGAVRVSPDVQPEVRGTPRVEDRGTITVQPWRSGSPVIEQPRGGAALETPPAVRRETVVAPPFRGGSTVVEQPRGGAAIDRGDVRRGSEVAPPPVFRGGGGTITAPGRVERAPDRVQIPPPVQQAPQPRFDRGPIRSEGRPTTVSPPPAVREMPRVEMPRSGGRSIVSPPPAVREMPRVEMPRSGGGTVVGPGRSFRGGGEIRGGASVSPRTAPGAGRIISPGTGGVQMPRGVVRPR